MLRPSMWVGLLTLFGTILTQDLKEHDELEHGDLYVNNHTLRIGRFGFEFLENVRQNICRSNICMSADSMPYLVNLICAVKCPELYLPHNASKSTTVPTITTSTSSLTTHSDGALPSTKPTMPTMPPTTRMPLTTRIPPTSRIPPTTRIPPTSRIPPTTGIPSTTRMPPTSRIPPTTRMPPTSRIPSTSRMPPTTTTQMSMPTNGLPFV